MNDEMYMYIRWGECQPCSLSSSCPPAHAGHMGEEVELREEASRPKRDC